MDILLLDLAMARGIKTSVAMHSILQQRATDLPTIIIAETATQLSLFAEATLLRSVRESIELPHRNVTPPISCHIVGRERVQHEQELAFAIAGVGTSEHEKRIANLYRAAWRATWQRLDADDIGGSIGRVLREELDQLRRQSNAEADAFSLAASLTSTMQSATRQVVEDRRIEIRAAAQRLINAGARRTLVVVGNQADAYAARNIVDPSMRDHVQHVRQAVETSYAFDAAILCGYWGQVTIDTILRAGAPTGVAWIIDPVEAARASSDCRYQSSVLRRFSLERSAHVVESLGEALQPYAVAFQSPNVDDRFEFNIPTVIATSGQATQQGAETHQAEVDLCFVDGTTMRVPDSHRFDVLRGGSPHAEVVHARELCEGDQILLVLGDHQQTLSDLLLEHMDSVELAHEAGLRRAWQQMCHEVAKIRRLTASRIAEEIRARGGHASTVLVRGWLQTGTNATQPRDYSTFAALAGALELSLPEDTLREYYDAIRRWRVAHRNRGRHIVKLLRLAWFGGLSAMDLARIEEHWGLRVRDLVEGSRLLEVDSIRLSA